MLNKYLLEGFLKYYYLFEAVCGNFLNDRTRRKLFTELASVFCLDECAELKTYYKESNATHFAEVTDIISYSRLSRLIEFAAKNGQDIGFTDVDRMILTQKREAMQIKEEIFEGEKNFTEESAFSTLAIKATDGNIDAMLMVAYMEYHGICADSDEVGAVKRMRKCAEWNNLFGNLMGLKYDAENQAKYFAILAAVLKGTGRKRMLDRICKTYSYKNEICPDEIAKIIEKAFGYEIIERNRFDKVFEKVAFSAIISHKSKETLLLRKKEGAFSAISDLSFCVREGADYDFDKSAFDRVVLKRDDEIKAIRQNIAVTVSCPAKVRRPLFISSSDTYLLDMYTSMLRNGFGKERVVVCSADTLPNGATKFAEQTLINALRSTGVAKTVVIIKNCHEFSDEAVEELTDMLDYDYRKNFRSSNHDVSLDFSDVVFVLTAKGHNSATSALDKICDTVKVKPISEHEKALVVESVVESKMKVFNLQGVEFEQECTAFLSKYDSDDIVAIVDNVIRRTFVEKTNKITLDMVKAVCKDKNIDSVRRSGFGYIGGAYNEEN